MKNKEKILKEIQAISQLSRDMEYIMNKSEEDLETTKVYAMAMMVKLESIKGWIGSLERRIKKEVGKENWLDV